MKLLICTQTVDKNDPILGFFHGWILEFAKHFSEIHIICLKKGSYDLPPHVFVYSLGKEEGENRLKYLYRFYRYFWRIFFKVRVNYIFFHMGEIYNILAAPFFLLRKFFGTKFYWWKTHGIIKLKAKFAAIFTDRIFTAGSKSFRHNSSKLKVVGHAIDVGSFQFSDRPWVEPIKAVTVGRVTGVKDYDLVIRAIAILRDQGVNISLRMVGPLDDVQYVNYIKQIIAEKNLDKRVELIGSKTYKEIVDEYHMADLLLHPARRAGFDKAVVEAMLCGVIPLTSIPSFEELLSKYGLYLDPSENAYVEGVARLVALSESERRTIKIRLYEQVSKIHSLASLKERIFGTQIG